MRADSLADSNTMFEPEKKIHVSAFITCRFHSMAFRIKDNFFISSGLDFKNNIYYNVILGILGDIFKGKRNCQLPYQYNSLLFPSVLTAN